MNTFYCRTIINLYYICNIILILIPVCRTTYIHIYPLYDTLLHYDINLSSNVIQSCSRWWSFNIFILRLFHRYTGNMWPKCFFSIVPLSSLSPHGAANKRQDWTQTMYTRIQSAVLNDMCVVHQEDITFIAKRICYFYIKLYPTYMLLNVSLLLPFLLLLCLVYSVIY